MIDTLPDEVKKLRDALLVKARKNPHFAAALGDKMKKKDPLCAKLFSTAEITQIIEAHIRDARRN